MSTIRTYAWLKQLSYFIHIHTQLTDDDHHDEEEKEEEKSEAQSTMYYVIIWTNVSLYRRLMGYAMQVVQCHRSHHHRSMID